MLQFILNGEKKSSYTKITQSSQSSLKLDNGSKCGFSGSGQYTDCPDNVLRDLQVERHI